MASDSTIARYRPAIAVLTALAAGCTVYYIHSTRQASVEPVSSSRRLRRSNAVIHRNRRRQDDPPRDATGWPRSIYDAAILLEAYRTCPDPLATFRFNIGTNEQGTIQFFEIPLSPVAFPSLEFIRHRCEVNEEAAEDIRQNYETAVMKAFLCQRLPPNCSIVDPGGSEAFVTEFERECFIFADSILMPITQFNDGAYEYLDERREAYECRGLRPPVRRRLGSGREEPLPYIAQQTQNATQPPVVAVPSSEEPIEVEDFALQPDEMDMDDESEQSWPGDENEESRREGQSLLNLLYHIAEDQARREGVVHRGVSCNSCNATPIHGIRYRCTNCVDYDLCEQCEAMQIHPKNHLFVKIRIPAPSHSSSRRPQPIWYPGTAQTLPNNLPRELNKSLTDQTGFSDNEVDAMWDQFKNLAAHLWPDDPDELGWAIDRESFDKCFVVSVRANQASPSSLIYDRMFSFYDTNHDGLIGFREFTAGLSAARSKDPDERHKRIFLGFDYDGDGYVNRRDLLLMFRAHYALQREFTKELVTDMEADLNEGGSLRDYITGTQPLSAAYQGTITPEPGHAGEGKQVGAHGDLVIADQGGAIAEDATDEGDLDQMIGDLHEIAQFGNLQEEDMAVQRSATPSLGPEGDLQVDIGGVLAEPRSTQFIIPETTVTDGILEAVSRISSGDWPPEHVADRDVERALGHSVALGEVTNESDRNKILKAAASRIKAEEERPRRQQARDSAIRDRHNRRHFYLDEEHRVFDSQVIQKQVSQTASSNGVGQATQSSMAGERSTEPAISVPKSTVRSDAPRESTQAPKSPPQAYREPPPLPVNVGQEILYQITQESINELLDPMFKLREDLAMENAFLEPQIDKYKSHLAVFKQEKMKELCKLQIDKLQSQWRNAEDDITLGIPVSAVLHKIIANQWDMNHEEYSRNLLDMFHIGMIDKETLDRKLEERRRFEDEQKNEVVPTPSETLRTDAPPQEAKETQTNGIEVAEQSTQAPQEHLSIADELDQGVRAFNDADPTVEASIREQPLPGLLSASGYSILDDERSQTANSNMHYNSDHDFFPDPTLPQNRPNTVPNEPPSSSLPIADQQQQAPQPPPPTPTAHSFDQGPRWTDLPANDQDQWPEQFKRFLKFLAMMEVVAREDEERGGPGKLSREEYEELVKGPKGPGLAFLSNWVDFHAL